jgi:hypothetical protein
VRVPSICAALVVCAAASAVAQDARPDPVEQMVRDAEAARARQVDRALSAPAKAFEPIERKPLTRYEDPAERPSIPWVPVAVGVGALLAVLLARVVWRWAGDERKAR